MIEIKGITKYFTELSTLRGWLSQLAEIHSYQIRQLSFTFVNDDEILRINREFLSHDYITDIITFDYTQTKKVSGEIYISLPQLTRQAKDYHVSVQDEILRVMAHGLLHLMGFDDKTKDQQAEMRSEEDKALLLHAQISGNNG